MAERGILTDADRVELVDGELIAMSPEGPQHAWLAAELVSLLGELYPRNIRVRSQSTLPTGPHTFVEPDLWVVDHHDPDAFPGPDDTLLIIEIAKTSAEWDLGGKADLYSQWGAKTYWVIDINADVLVAHTDPTSDGYRMIETYRPGQSIALPALELTVGVTQLLHP
jgi:Uma2 family endonuclease